MLRLLALVFSLWLGALPTAAISYSPAALLSWEEVVDRSTFAGMIECTYAGAAISEFKVVEAWKSEITETPFRFDAHTLVGERLIVGLQAMPTEGKREPQLQELLMPIAGLGRLYTVWPEPPADYQVTDSLTISAISVNQDSNSAGVNYGPHLATVEAYRWASERVVRAGGSEREALLIAAAMRSFMENPTELDNAFLASPERTEPGDITNLDDLLAVLFAEGSSFEEKHLGWALGRAGGIQTLARLDNLSRDHATHSTLIAEAEDAIVHRLKEDNRRHQGLPSASPEISVGKARRHLNKYEVSREDLGSQAYHRWKESIALLTLDRPRQVADFLAEFDPEPFHYHAAAQNLASWFSRNCNADRVACYETLVEAKSPPIAAVGAFYLAFADQEAGLARLETMALRRDRLGRWATHTLVAHGKRAYVEQALSLDDTLHDPQGQIIHLYPVYPAAISVLSNAAERAGVPQPDAASYRGHRNQDLLGWWNTYADRLTLEPLPFVWPPAAGGVE